MKTQAAACDIVDKRRRIAQNRCKDLTVDELLGLIDQPHLKIIGVLQWLDALTKNIPQLAVYKFEVSLRYRTRAAKLQLPIEKSKVHPLATSGKNEANIGDLKDGFVDFLEQLGHQDGDYDKRLWFAGGDGMSYKNMLTLKKYLQTHPDAFQRFELMQPVLQVWHTQWTNLSRIYEHLGEPLNNNSPSTWQSCGFHGSAVSFRMLRHSICPASEFHLNGSDMLGLRKILQGNGPRRVFTHEPSCDQNAFRF